MRLLVLPWLLTLPPNLTDPARTNGQQVSLVAISFRDSGFRTLPDWIKPFQQEFGALIQGTNSGVRVFQVNLEDKTWLKVCARVFGGEGDGRIGM